MEGTSALAFRSLRSSQAILRRSARLGARTPWPRRCWRPKRVATLHSRRGGGRGPDVGWRRKSELWADRRRSGRPCVARSAT